MKRSTLILASVSVGLGLTVGLFAGMNDVTFQSGASIASAAANTNSGYVLRGTIEGVSVKIGGCASAVRTNTVSITSADGQTIFSATILGTSTNFYPLAIPLYSTAGAQINSSTVAATTNSVYAGIPVASKVTSIVTGADQSALTNTVTVKVLVRE